MDEFEFVYAMKSFKETMENGELLNGRLAMLGVVAAIGSYVMTGQIIPGYF